MMSYSPDIKSPPSDEEQRVAGWIPMTEHQMDTMRTRDAKMKKRLRIVRLIVRIATFILACFMLYTQIYMLQKFYSTQSIVRDGRDAWAKQTQLWPTYLLLTTSALTVLVSAITIFSYVWGVKGANWSYQRIYGPWVGVEIAAHLSVWIGTVIGYRVGKTGNDLWGWSCSPKADAIQNVFKEVDFNWSCALQSNAWVVSIAQAALIVVVAVTWLLAYRRNKHKKRLNYRESHIMSQEYGPKPDSHLLPSGNIPYPGA